MWKWWVLEEANNKSVGGGLLPDRCCCSPLSSFRKERNQGSKEGLGSSLFIFTGPNSHPGDLKGPFPPKEFRDAVRHKRDF